MGPAVSVCVSGRPPRTPHESPSALFLQHHSRTAAEPLEDLETDSWSVASLGSIINTVSESGRDVPLGIWGGKHEQFEYIFISGYGLCRGPCAPQLGGFLGFFSSPAYQRESRPTHIHRTREPHTEEEAQPEPCADEHRGEGIYPANVPFCVWGSGSQELGPQLAL
ncbi:hypothetical protein H920_12206 [Fukomys damarensis]|uniref:Uncharacterized protein n=1 Tax=Fukomys damarensis TaxID=885580 RepID=A0A091D2T9_FUKDA|nr:hypothetical protein H920_12206 [Fukomys damarensis]